jgi:ribosomal protein S21
VSAVLETPMERRPAVRPPLSSRRPANVIVVARYPGEPVESLLRRWKRASQDSGLQRLIKRGAPLYFARSPGQKARAKHRAALKAQQKSRRKAAQFDARLAAAGR